MKLFGIASAFVALIFLASCAGTRDNATDDDLAGDEGTSAPAAPLGEFRITAHSLTFSLDPAKHRLEAVDRISLEAVKGPACPVSFVLNTGLAISSIRLEPQGDPADLRTTPGGGSAAGEPVEFKVVLRLKDPESTLYDHVLVKLPQPMERCALSVHYSGELYDFPKRDEQLRFVIGTQTNGTIGPEGVYLHGGTYWYPTTEGMMAKFEMKATTPKGWEVVGQGTRWERKEENDHVVTLWGWDVPTDSLSVVAGQYVVQEEKRDGVTIATYFFPSEKDLAKQHIDAAAKYIEFYSQILGRYPCGFFSIVENFFPTGYGMPSYTLLAQEVVKTPQRHLAAGGLGHEIVHCWWGNYVVPDWENGNWCEGLTTYLANYFWAETHEGADKARDYRYKQMLKYSVVVNDSNEYPVRRFAGKTEEVDNEIGYGKCSMMFHLLRRMMGDGPFFAALRNITHNFGGRRASWSDFQAAFEKKYGKELGWFFDEWLDRTGAPMLSLSPAPEGIGSGAAKVPGEGSTGVPPVPVKTTKEEDGSWRTEFSIFMENPEPYHLYNVGVQGETETGSSCALIAVGAPETKVSINAKEPPRFVTVDPDYHVFRRLRPGEYPACLNVTSNDTPRVVVIPTGGAADECAVYEGLAARIVASGGWTSKRDKEMTEADLGQSSLLVLGRPGINSVAARFAGLDTVEKIVSLEPAAFVFKGNRYEGERQSLMISFRNPLNEARHVTLFMGVTKDAAAAAQRLLFYYGWENWYIFEGERATQRGMYEESRNALRIAVPR
ncbi:MAG: M1 family aminopeptidase [Planctomycetota bacterium]|nr:M1 family aminopeptidase [Planctomycetota bacterium]